MADQATVSGGNSGNGSGSSSGNGIDWNSIGGALPGIIDSVANAFSKRPTDITLPNYTPPAPEKSNTGLYIGMAAGGFLLILIIVILLMRR